MRGIVCGIGINDADYLVVKKEQYIGPDGSIKIKKTTCPFYRAWADMLSRCYREKYHKVFPSYKDCSVCDDWIRFTNFKRWMEQQDYKDNVLDKDLKVTGNKVYSPETCLFISPKVNGYITIKHGRNTSGLIGASYQTTSKQRNKWISSCSQLNGKNKTLGRFATALEAHLAWCKFKAEMGEELIKEQNQELVIQAIQGFVNNLELCANNGTPFKP